jgi:hypothetical protein
LGLGLWPSTADFSERRKHGTKPGLEAHFLAVFAENEFFLGFSRKRVYYIWRVVFSGPIHEEDVEMKKCLLVAGLVAVIGGFGCGGGGGGGAVTNPPNALFTFPWDDTVVVNGMIDPGEVIHFTDGSTVNGTTLSPITKWSWKFPGGVPATYALQGPVDVTFALPGFYSVSLKVTDAAGKSNTYTHAISVRDSSDSTLPDIDVTKVKLKGVVNDNVGVTVLTNNIGGAGAVNIPGVTKPTPANTDVAFTTQDITMGTGTHGDSTNSVVIQAKDAANNTTNVTVTITEDEQP